MTARSSAVRVVLLAWLVAGTLDILAAVTYYPLTTGVRPAAILRGIASGVLGARAFDGGAATAALGLLLHYVIALIWTMAFLLAARRLEPLTRHPIPAIAALILMFCIGLPIAGIIGRHARS